MKETTKNVLVFERIHVHDQCFLHNWDCRIRKHTHLQRISPLNVRTWYITARDNSSNRIYVWISTTDPIANRIGSHHKQHCSENASIISSLLRLPFMDLNAMENGANEQKRAHKYIKIKCLPQLISRWKGIQDMMLNRNYWVENNDEKSVWTSWVWWINRLGYREHDNGKSNAERERCNIISNDKLLSLC
jgi:hypothetical protein